MTNSLADRAPIPAPGSHAFPPGRWRGRWIWAAERAPGGGREVVALRRTLDLASVPDRVPARMAALSRYALWVNGTEVSRGPVRANPRQQPYDDVDLAPYLRPGANAVAVLAWRYDGPKPWWMPPSPLANDLHEGAFVLEARLADGWFVSDESWQARVLPGWGDNVVDRLSGRGEEHVDCRVLPAAWCTALASTGAGGQAGDSCGDAGWPAATARRAMTTGEPGRAEPPSFPGGPLGARPIAQAAPVEVALRRTAAGAYVADRIESGTLVVDASGPPGASVTVRVAEFLAGGEPAPGEHDACFTVTLDGTRRTAESLDLYGLHGALVEAGDGVTVHGIGVRTRTYPVTGGAAFRCSDPVLERIWEIGRRTVTLCSADAYIDCPTREQRAWVGDAVVHQMVDFATNSDWRLARWYPRMAASPRSDGMLPMAVAGDVEYADFTVIPDWSLHWVHAVWNSYRYVGDRDEIGGLLPAVEGVLRWFLPFRNADGLLEDVFGWVLIDWASVTTDGVCAALCGLWGRALQEFAEMAAWLGDEGRAAWARGMHRQLAAGFELLWDAERGRYADSLTEGGRGTAASQHAQAAAIVGGLAPRERWARLVEVLTDTAAHVDAAFSSPDAPAVPGGDLPVGGAYLRIGHPEPWWDTDKQVVRAQPFFRYVVHDALAAAGRADLVAGLCLDWTAALERCATSWSETWYGGTVSHGWSSTPTRDLVVRVLGVEPAEPGFGVARIEPALGALDSASGEVPCPAGLIAVAVTGTRLDVDSPVPFRHGGGEYAAGRHSIPLAGGRSVASDGVR
ncbi:alpha-L-rhamnosidase-related protein [Yinghuangia soli]|uniref:Alpha-L-rhamnosidase six-hairpin glycosidase domain-containing protein n=1 Tax=Yinghuangia soli TaxID=2908204 RepID=A0AA41Q8E6_9ACTN|nr:hypothetical protein [Yinghuangia soli]MCF2533137.1 hypothetical protein [Yinghuangia soli]